MKLVLGTRKLFEKQGINLGVVGIISVSLLFWLVAYVALDPDFGWHIRLGELIVREGVPQTDPFSYTMPSYPYIDHEWLSQVGWYFLNTYIGRAGLAFLYTGMALGAIAVMVPPKLRRFSFIPVLLTVGVMLSRFGIRVQVISWFLVALLIRLLLTKDAWVKYRLFVPPLLLLWANLHGSFIVGVGILGVYLVGQLLEKRFDRKDFLLTLTATLITLGNPYGFRLWGEIYHQLTSDLLQTTIVEWLPFYHKVEFGFWMLVVFAVAVIGRFRRSFPTWYVMINALFLLMSLMSVRQAVYFSLASIPLVVRGFQLFTGEVTPIPGGGQRLRALAQTFVLLTLFIFLVDTVPAANGWLRWREDRAYPAFAIRFLTQHASPGELFAPYAWGGYLDWKLPKRKVFIDGRMPTFRWDGPPGESDNAYADYLRITEGAQTSILDTYHVRSILWHNPTATVGDGRFAWVRSSLRQLFNTQQPGEPKWLTAIKNSGWREIYRDEVAVIYSRPQ